MKAAIMRTKFAIFLATASLLLAIVEPSFAGPQRHRPADAYASSAAIHEQAIPHPSDRSFGRFWSDTGFPAAGTAAEPLGPGRNLPYPDRPYGDPDRW
jgi:hypothetical protein